eukprot:tig00022075_g23642.t1
MNLEMDVSRVSEDIIKHALLLSTRGLVLGTCGNISVRIAPDLFLITPSGIPYTDLVNEDLVLVRISTGNVEKGIRNPSIETPLHRAVYLQQPFEVAASVVHTHSKMAVSVACCRRPLPCITDTMAVFLGGEVPCAKYAPIGTQALADSVAAELGPREDRPVPKVVLMANHGLIAFGKSLKEAFFFAELAEETCAMYIHSLALGPVPLSEEEQAANRLSTRSYGQPKKAEAGGSGSEAKAPVPAAQEKHARLDCVHAHAHAPHFRAPPSA